jgi:hypothetical protein
MLIERRAPRLYASHHQFYVEDGVRPGDTGDPWFWTKKAASGLPITGGFLKKTHLHWF